MIATCRDFPVFPRRERAPCEYLFIAIAASAAEGEEVLPSALYQELGRVQGTLEEIEGEVSKTRALPSEVQDLID